MADNTKQLSKVTIIDSDGKTTSAHFAADINNFIAYDNNGAENSVKDCVFGATDPGTFKSIKDTAGNITTDNSMWSKLDTKARECYNILDNNKSFWDGLSKAEYTQPSDPGSTVFVAGEYLASGDQINALRFYGEDAGDSMEGQRQKLISLGALEDFAKRVPKMGGSHTIGQNQVALNPDSQATGTNSFAVNGGQAAQKNSVAIGPGTLARAENQTVLGQYNQLDSNALFIIGAGTSEGSPRNSLKIDKDGNVWLPKMRKGSNNLNDSWESYIKQDSDVSQKLPAGFISGTFTVGYRKADKTWLGDGPRTFDIEKGVQTSLNLQLGQISDSEVIRVDIKYDGKDFVDIQGMKARQSDGHEESISITLLYAEMCVLNFF